MIATAGRLPRDRRRSTPMTRIRTWHAATMALMTLVGCGPPSRSEQNEPSDSAPAVHEGIVTVKLHVPDPGGIDVYFQDESSVLLGHVVSDDTGIVTGPMRDNGFVTVFDGVHEVDGVHSWSSHDLYTFTTVQVGDELVVGTRQRPSRPLETTVRFQRSVNLENVQLTAADCDIEVLQGTTTATATTVDRHVSLTNCDPVVDLLAIAVGQDGVPTGWTVVHGVTLADEIDLTGATFAPMVQQDVTLANIPAEVPTLWGLTSDVVTTDGAYLHPRSYPEQGVDTFHFDLAAVPAASNVVSLWATNRHNEWIEIFDRHDTLDSRTVDVGARLLPPASCLTYSFDRREVTWAETAVQNALVPDYVIAEISVIRPSGSDHTVGFWHLVGPYDVVAGLDGATQLAPLRAPLLPPELVEQFNPDPAPGAGWGLSLERGAIAGGYPALRMSGLLPASTEFADSFLRPFVHGSIAFAERPIEFEHFPDNCVPL